MKHLSGILTLATLSVICCTTIANATKDSFEIDIKDLRTVKSSKDNQQKSRKKGKVPISAKSVSGAESDGSSDFYTVRPGDHLHLILVREYRLPANIAERLVPEIMSLNGIKNPRRLNVGQRLRIPASVRTGHVDTKIRKNRSVPPEQPPEEAAEEIPQWKTATIHPDHSCAVAKSVIEQLELLAPDKLLPNKTAFSATNGERKRVIACGLSSDETYTYTRLLALTGATLLTFNEDDPPRLVIEELSGELGIKFEIADTDLPGTISYRFPPAPNRRHGVRLTLETVAGKIVPSTANKEPEVMPTIAAQEISPATAAAGNSQGDIAGTVAAREVLPATAVQPSEATDSKQHEAQPDQIPSPAVEPAPESPEKIWDLYLLAKANDPSLGRSEARLTASSAESDVILSSLFPHVSAGAGINQIRQSLYNYSDKDTKSSVLGNSYNISASMPLLHFPTLYNLSASSAGLRSEEAAVIASRQNLIVRFAESCFSILKASQDLQIANDEIRRLQQLLEQAQAFLNVGTGDVIAVYEAQARLDAVVAELSKAESVVLLAEQKLSGIVGRPVKSIESFLPIKPAGPEPDDLEWWLATMEKHEPTIQQAREGLAQSVEQLKSAKAEHLPVLQASGGYNSSKGSAFLPHVETRQWTVGATISLPIFSGGETSARIRRAVANETERRFALDEIREQRRENLKLSFYNLSYNVKQIKALEKKKASAEIQLNAVKKGRSIGTRSAIDVINAEQSYSVALRDLINARYDNALRNIQLKFAAGILNDSDVQAVSGATATTR